MNDIINAKRVDMQKLRYEIDPYNRLAIGKRSLPKFRKVIDGQFKVNKNNELSYHVKTPFLKDEEIPHQLKLRGRWSLTDNHNLCLTLDKLGRRTFGDKVTLQGEIIDINKNSLLFAITTKTKEGITSTYIIDLKGSWKADKNNRLSFYIKKEKGKHDILIFRCAWEINKNHQIIYKYEKADLVRKKKKSHTLTFKGYWDIKDRLRISYVLDKETDSLFDFKAGLGIFKENYIKYELGIDLANRIKPVRKTITLFGKWKIKKNKGIIFEIEYENRKVHAIVFGADARLTDKDTLLLRLKNDIANKEIGVTLRLSHKILKGKGEAFLELLKSKKESAIYVGSAYRW